MLRRDVFRWQAEGRGFLLVPLDRATVCLMIVKEYFLDVFIDNAKTFTTF